MDESFINLEEATAEQKFSLMLLERLEKMEKRFDNYMFGTPVVVPLVSQESIRKLDEIIKIHAVKEVEARAQKIQKTVPPNILSKVPPNLYQSLLNAMCNPYSKDDNLRSVHDHSFVAEYAIAFLKKFKEADAEFIEWFNNTLKL